MEILWRIRDGFMEKMCRFCGGSIIVEKICRNYGETMEYLWNIDGDFVCILWKSYEDLMEVLWNIDGRIVW